MILDFLRQMARDAFAKVIASSWQFLTILTILTYMYIYWSTAPDFNGILISWRNRPPARLYFWRSAVLREVYVYRWVYGFVFILNYALYYNFMHTIAAYTTIKNIVVASLFLSTKICFQLSYC